MWPSGGLWRHRDFLHLWAAQSLSALGSRITRTAIPVIAVIAVDGSALQLGVLSALSLGPGAAVALLAAGRVDRSRKRPVLIGADLARALLLLSLPAAAWLDALTMGQLYAVAGAVGCATALFQIADNAYLPALVGRQSVVEGNARLETTDSIAEIAGPGLAGLLIDALTAPVAIVVDAASYLWSALLLRRIRAHETPAPAGDGDRLGADLRAGFAACWKEPRVRPLLLSSALSTLSGGFLFALYMLFALDTLGLSPAAVGLVIGVGGVGALAGALLSPGLARRAGLGPAMLICLLAGQAAGLLIPLAGGATSLAVGLLVAHQLVGDAFLVAFEIQAVSLRQSLLPLDLLARANAVFNAAASALLPLGALLGGLVGEALGVRAGIWVGVAGGLLAPLPLLPLRSLRRMPT